MFVSFPKILKYFAIFTNSYTWLSSIASKPYPQICLDLCNPHYRTVCEAKGQARLEHSWNGNIPELESRSGLVRVGGGDRRGGCGYERATEGVLVVEPRWHRDVVVDTPIYGRQVMQNTEQHGENRGRGVRSAQGADDDVMAVTLHHVKCYRRENCVKATSVYMVISPYHLLWTHMQIDVYSVLLLEYK